MTQATAPGKVILIGEHAVVYGRPAIAVPVWELVATVTVTDGPPGSGCTLTARDLQRTQILADASADDPLALVARLTLTRCGLPPDPDWQIEVESQLPIAGGLGSGAAVGTALVRAICSHAGQPCSPQQVSDLVFASERLHHGTPSGIDNAVIAYGQPIWFVRGEVPLPFVPRRRLLLAIADSGIASPTRETVGAVARSYAARPQRFAAIFDQIGAIATRARSAIETGQIDQLGSLFDQNQDLLAELGVSSPPLDILIAAARRAGAIGAKLSGGGRGGNIIALVTPESAAAVATALRVAGARHAFVTGVGPK